MRDLRLTSLDLKDSADIRPLVRDAFMWLVEPQYPSVDHLRMALAVIKPEAQQIIIRAYGLDGGKPLSLTSIATESASSFRSIHAIYSEALAQLAQLLLSAVAPSSLVEA